MFNKFQTLIKNLTENTVGMAMPGGTDAALGQVSAQYGIGKVTPASEADIAVANLSSKKKKKKIIKRTLPKNDL
jgi:hypothetical protein